MIPRAEISRIYYEGVFQIRTALERADKDNLNEKDEQQHEANIDSLNRAVGEGKLEELPRTPRKKSKMKHVYYAGVLPEDKTAPAKVLLEDVEF